MSFTDLLRQQLSRAVAAIEAVSRDVTSYRTLTDDALLEFARSTATQQRLLGATAAVIAGEIARRSEASLGAAGLAQRTGHRTAVELVRATTGSTGREAAAVVRVGVLTQGAADAGSTDPVTGELLPAGEPWLHSLGRGVAAGSLSAAAAEAIRAGLGEPSDSLSEVELADAVDTLCAESRVLDADRLFRRARELRDRLDEAGIADREDARRQARSLRFVRLPDGMARLTWMMDPETAAVSGDIFDRATSPRRGGPRFVDAHDATSRLAQRIAEDPRTTEQLASDVFTELLRHGAAADSSQLLGTGAPIVHLIVTREALDSRSGHAHFEGHPDPVSIETAERAVCSSTIEPLLFNSAGQALDVGREQRLYTHRQRRALAVRDGGCRFPGCDRPPSWTEAHHTKFWARDHGATDIEHGILLCRHHHLLCHNNHWEIERVDGDFVVIPPPDIDPRQRPIPMPTKSPALRELQAIGARAARDPARPEDSVVFHPVGVT